MAEEDKQYDEPTDADKKLVSWVIEHTDVWRDYRDTNFKQSWLEYERIFRGQWAAEDKQRDSERSRFISPATQQAVETRHAEIMEAIFGQGEFFDISDDIKDVNGNPLDVMQLKAQLHEDFKRDGIRKAIDSVELMAEIYGTGIAEILVQEEKTYKPATQPIPGAEVAAIGVEEGTRFSVKLTPVNPKHFLIDYNADCIDEALGVAIEKTTSLHKVMESIDKGTYRKVKVEGLYSGSDLEPTQEKTNTDNGNCVVLRYYGLVPRALLEEPGTETVSLFPDQMVNDSEKYSDLVEAIIVIANGSTLLKAEENPYMMKDRPVVAYQDDTVPGRFWGRGTVEKAYNTQKAIDGTLRADADSRALTTAPMIAMDATRLPRGAKYEVKAGKSLLTNGNPSEILMPFNFGQHRPDNAVAAQNFERMLLQATGTVDSAGMPSSMSRDAGEGAMSMALAGIIKKYKRTLTNFQEDFLIKFINKAAWRYMQFDPERYPSVDMDFLPTGALGILAREYEQQQLINMLKTLGPDTPVMPLILKGIISNGSLSNRAELLSTLDQMSQPNPEQQQKQMQQEQLQQRLIMAQIAETEAKAQKAAAEAQKAMVEAETAPLEAKARMIAALSNNLDDDQEGKDFERRVKLADIMLKEKDLELKRLDIDSNERIAKEQMANQKAQKEEVTQTLED